MTGTTENHMLMELAPVRTREEVKERLRGPGYLEIGTDNFVSEEDAFDYALEQCLKVVPGFIHRIEWTEEFREMLVEWFYSGNWIKED